MYYLISNTCDALNRLRNAFGPHIVLIENDTCGPHAKQHRILAFVECIIDRQHVERVS